MFFDKLDEQLMNVFHGFYLIHQWINILVNSFTKCFHLICLHLQNHFSSKIVSFKPMENNHKGFCYILLKNLYINTYYPEGLSFFALILLTSRLYDVNNEVNFIYYVSSTWLPSVYKVDKSETNEYNSKHILHIENLQQDFDNLIVELLSSRTTLILSIIFVLIYILSWGWMAYAVRHTRNVKNVSFKTVLQLAVFAAIDIAASAGFVLVRLIMLCVRDHGFMKDMRVPSFDGEHDQLIAFTALRHSIIKSGSGSTDVFVSVIIGFLTGLRIYSVFCAISLYNEIKRDSKFKNLDNSLSVCASDYSKENGQNAHLDKFFTKSAPYFARSRERSGRDTSVKEKIDSRYSIITSTSLSEKDNNEMVIQQAEMPSNLRKKAIQCVLKACSLYNTEKHIAQSIKESFDELHEPIWHCIVGRNWASCITHSKQCYIRLLYKDMTILLYKSK